MPERTKRLPVVPSTPASSCDTGECGGCTGGGCSSVDKARGRLAAAVMALVIAAAAIPLWFLPRGVGSSQPAAPAPSLTRVAPPPPVRLVAATTAVAPTAAPMICRGWPMPHEPRGACESCHTVAECPPPGAAAQPQEMPPPFALPTITRNSLLPHRFAGACMHCHFIVEEGPTPVNRDNMDALPLTRSERELVQAGQQVIPPSVLTRMNAPVLGHGTMLPHSYWGVCSNCHRVVDFGFGRGPDASRQSIELARTPLVSSDATPRRIAHGRTTPEGRVRLILCWTFGFVALGLFLVSAVYVAMKIYLRSRPKQEQGRLRKALHLTKWFRIHEWTSLAFGGAVVLHWIFSDLGSALLHVSLLLVVALTLSGVFYRYRVPSLTSKKSMRWLHTQRFLFYVLIVTTVLGHVFVFARPGP